MEYISKQSLLADLNEATPRSYFAFETMVRVYPTEDVVPVVHAHWIPQSRLKHILYYLQTGQDFCSCSNCTSCGNKLMRHCPTCMAKMDEKEGQR